MDSVECTGTGSGWSVGGSTSRGLGRREARRADEAVGGEAQEWLRRERSELMVLQPKQKNCPQRNVRRG
jgi:hypothetical protein